jgi:hypothetical protein
MSGKKNARPDDRLFNREQARESEQVDETGFHPDAYEATPPPDTGPQPAGTGQPPSNGPPGTTATNDGPDPYDPKSLRLSPDFGASLGVRKVLLSVAVRRPDRSWWVRSHPSEDFRIQTAVLELKSERGGSETYLVAQPLWPELAAEPTFKLKLLATAVNRQGTCFLWEANLPRPDGRSDEWGRSALEAMNMAKAGWVRVIANMDAGAYDVLLATGQIPDPEWPDVTFSHLLRVAFKERLITTLDHPILRRLRGEV